MSDESNLEIKNPMEDIKVSVRFLLGELQMALGELKSIQPGYVFELDTKSSNPVAISVNETLIGRGALVLVDGRLAIHFTEATDHGT